MLRLPTNVNQQQQKHQQINNPSIHQSSPNTQLFGATYLGDDTIKQKRFGRRGSESQQHNQQQQHQQQQQAALLQQITQISPNGRYGAPRPTCSMAEVLKY